MELLIFSDSHGNPHGMYRRLKENPNAIVVHLGDGVRDLDTAALSHRTVYAVRGNCDLFEERPEEIVMSLEGHVVLMTHGHRYAVKQGLERLLAHAAEVGADLVLFGHTHRAEERYFSEGTVVGEQILSRGIYLCNPGSVGRGSGGAAASFGRLLLQRGNVLFSVGQV